MDCTHLAADCIDLLNGATAQLTPTNGQIYLESALFGYKRRGAMLGL